MTVPAYLPTKQSGESYLGDEIGKQNYQALPPSNPLTDQDNTLISPAFVDVANLGQTCPQVVVGFTTAASTGALALNYYSALWINATATLPILTRVTTGVFTITFPPTVSHEYTLAADNIANNITVVLNRGAANFTNALGFLQVNASGNVITVNTYNTSSSANDLVGAGITVVGF